MFRRPPTRTAALLEALAVNIIWASSYILVKIALRDFGPLTIGGLRYFLGFLVLFPFLFRRGGGGPLAGRQVARLFLLGIVGYTLANGATFFALQYLPASTVSFMMGIIALLVMLGGVLFLHEVPGWLQTLGFIISLAGMALFFSPGLGPGEPLGLGIMAFALLGFSLFGIIGRSIARTRQVNVISLTALPLAFGGACLLLLAFITEGVPDAPISAWLIVFWLAVVNTALAYAAYNHALQVLTAYEMNILLNLGPLWTAMMSIFFFDERLAWMQWLGLILVVAGVILVQRRRRPAGPAAE